MMLAAAPSKIARRTLVNMPQRYIPYLYTDLFDKYKTDMVLSSSLLALRSLPSPRSCGSQDSDDKSCDGLG
jgi:hypothetical protein